jgi:uncharacterized membrane protein
MRGLAALFMVMQHSILVYEYTSGEETGIIGTVLVVLGTAPAAPIFMLVMGVFMMKSTASNWAFVRRGFKLLLAGYVLNFLRFSLPLLLDGQTLEAFSMLFYVDIFQLAGVFFVSSVLFRKVANNLYFSPLFSLAILFISPYLWGITPQTPVTDLFWGMGETVSFPFFPWCVYPLLGMYLSKYIGHASIEKKYRVGMTFIASAFCVVGFSVLGLFPYSDYQRFGFGASILMIAFVLFYTLATERITNKLALTPNNKIVNVLVFWSENLTNIYWISWILFSIIAIIIGYNLYNDLISGIIGIIVMVLSHLLIKHTKIVSIIPRI